ncbi:MAG: GWxTD domain-containing protein [Bacteroidales bacterium]|nr:GWxTD domain-containing protein [Bacteroidales bacterium]
MKRNIIFLIIIGLSAMLSAQEKQLNALFNFNAFYHTEQQRPYVETYLSFDAWTLNFVPTADGRYRATVEIVLTAQQDDSIVYVKKYDLNSPAIADSTATDFNFLDLQRFFLDNGVYTLNLSVRDKASQQPAVSASQKIQLFFDRIQPNMSNLQLIASAKKTETPNMLSRAGYDMEPYLSDYLPSDIERMSIYYEIYNLTQEIGNDPFLTCVTIEDYTTGRKIDNLQLMTRHKSADFSPVFSTLDISSLPSGHYNLLVEVRNKNNETLLYKRLPFYRANSDRSLIDNLPPASGTFAAEITDEKQMNYYLDALYPIASEAEKDAVKQMVKRTDLEEKQAFFYKFWTDRDPLRAEERWREYRGWLEYVDEHFSYPRTPGYRTDRGRVYLQYGPPDFIRDEKNFVSALKLGSGTDADRRRVYNQAGEVVGTESLGPKGVSNPSQGHVYYLPYQLWRYNKLERDDANRVFLFWDEMRSGFYKLLVSNARGEVMDPLWERRLSQQQLEEYVVGEVGEQFNRGH